MKMVLLYGFKVLNWSGLNQLIGLFFLSFSFFPQREKSQRIIMHPFKSPENVHVAQICLWWGGRK